MLTKASERCTVTRIEIVYHSIGQPELLKIRIQFFFIDLESMADFAKESKYSYDQNVFHIYYY